MKGAWWLWLGLLVLLVLSLWLRWPAVDARPMHTDEIVQAARMANVLEQGTFAYDPGEYHGPTLPYLAAGMALLRGQSTFAALDEVTLRLVPLIVAGVLLLLSAGLRRELGTAGVLIAGLLLALSPIMVFYSTVYIHEYLLVLFCFTTLVLTWRYLQKPGWLAAAAVGVSIGLVHATKTTGLLHLAAMGAAFVAAWLLQRRYHPPPPEPYHVPSPAEALNREAQRQRVILQLTLAAACFFFITVLLYSAFFTHWQGVRDSFLAYLGYVGRGMGTAAESDYHVFPWYQHLQRLLWNDYRPHDPIWTEGLILLLAMVGLIGALLPMSKVKVMPRTQAQANGPDVAVLLRCICLYPWLLLVLYSAVPYKTPWLMLGVAHGMILAAAVGAMLLWRWLGHWSLRSVVTLLLLVATLHLAVQGYRAGRWFTDRPMVLLPADRDTPVQPRPSTPPPKWADYVPAGTFYVRRYHIPSNPWVYAQTSTDMEKFAQQMRRVLAASPQGERTRVHIFSEDPWPMWWYLREHPTVGAWQSPPTVELTEAPVVIIVRHWAGHANHLTPDNYQRLNFTQRPGMGIYVYLRKDVTGGGGRGSDE